MNGRCGSDDWVVFRGRLREKPWRGGRKSWLRAGKGGRGRRRRRPGRRERLSRRGKWQFHTRKWRFRRCEGDGGFPGGANAFPRRDRGSPGAGREWGNETGERESAAGEGRMRARAIEVKLRRQWHSQVQLGNEGNEGKKQARLYARASDNESRTAAGVFLISTW